MTFFSVFTKKICAEKQVFKALPLTVKHSRRIRRSSRIGSYA